MTRYRNANQQNGLQRRRRVIVVKVRGLLTEKANWPRETRKARRVRP
jgi:hypothetical protein